MRLLVKDDFRTNDYVFILRKDGSVKDCYRKMSIFWFCSSGALSDATMNDYIDNEDYSVVLVARGGYLVDGWAQP